jgi:nicotinic acid mononucleotide adenylyltransferase
VRFRAAICGRSRGSVWWSFSIHRFDPAQIAVGTASLVRYLQGEHPDVEFHFCLGEDSFWDVVNGKWKESERVLDAFRNQLWVVRRAASSDERATAVPGLVEAAGVGARILHVHNMTSVSSSRVRACRNMEELKTLVAAPVLRYMEANGLYSFATGML